MQTDPTRTTIDEAKLQDFLGRMLGDLGAAAGAALALIGDRLGLYRSQAESGPVTVEAFAERTGIAGRHLREWLSAQAAAGYVEYDAETQRFSMTPEQAAVLADESSPAFLAGIFDSIASMFHATPRLEEAFRNGRGVGWHEHHECLFRGTERFFRPLYAANLVQNWLPALDGVVSKMGDGGRHESWWNLCTQRDNRR